MTAAMPNVQVPISERLSVFGKLQEITHYAQEEAIYCIERPMQYVQGTLHRIHLDPFTTNFKVHTFAKRMLALIGSLLQVAALTGALSAMFLSFLLTPMAMLGLVPALLSAIAGSILYDYSRPIVDSFHVPLPFYPGQPVGVHNADGTSCWLAAALQFMIYSAEGQARLREPTPDITVRTERGRERLRDLYPADASGQFASPLSQFLDQYLVAQRAHTAVAPHADILAVRRYLSLLAPETIIARGVQLDAADFFGEVLGGRNALYRLEQTLDGRPSEPQLAATVQIEIGPILHADPAQRTTFVDQFCRYFTYANDQGQVVQLQFLTHPSEMLVQLRRFRQVDDAQGRFLRVEKIQDGIDVPSQLQLPAAYVGTGQEAAYQCDGFIIHQGVHEGGHYIAMMKVGKFWYECDSSFVHQITEAEAMAQLPQAYFVHYTKVE